jgi:superfamily II RNA helicase
MLMRVLFCHASWMCLIVYSNALVPITRFSFKSNPLFAARTTSSSDITQAIEIGRELLQPYFNFPLDNWQLQAGGEIYQGSNVIVCAPTGAGKTVVGEMALHLARERGQKAIYTTPLKALSNQKFAELRQIFGNQNVGLSTGDMSINRDAQLRVMTTEVYRNMAWRSSGLEGKDGSTASLQDDELVKNGVVVLDEFHYMGQPGRGGVWEESVITTPTHSQIVGLSATLPNANKLAQWMQSVSGRKTVLVEAGGARPVPLRYLFATKSGLYPLFHDPDAGPGAPKGLLGLRGDGIPEIIVKSKNRKEGNQSVKSPMELEFLPKGLQINPVLKALAQKRRARVNKAIERMKTEEFRTGYDNYRDQSPWKRDFSGANRLSAKEERRERERLLKREMRKEVPSLSTLVRRLSQTDRLPAILFIFSRAGCDMAAQEISQQFMGPIIDIFDDKDVDDEYNEGVEFRRRKSGRIQPSKPLNRLEDKRGRNFRRGGNYVDDESLEAMLDFTFSKNDIMFDDSLPLKSDNWQFYASAGLLNFGEVKEVAFRVSSFNSENKEIAFEEGQMEQFLLGIGSHHAGMLPAHKAFVETLYRAQLMKVVFATETLAAGINMPARTTCICSLAKRGDGSTMSLLETSNLLQMAGRAGRRGMDTAGTCVILSTPFENEEDASQILISEVKPITSQFAPSYSLAINLISRGNGKVEIARRLVEKSFAMWEKREFQNKLNILTNNEKVDSIIEILQVGAQEQFLLLLADAIPEYGEKEISPYQNKRISDYTEVLREKKVLKGASKEYIAIAAKVEIEKFTLECLENELEGIVSNNVSMESEALEVEEEERFQILNGIELQRLRVNELELELSNHPFTIIAEVGNQLMSSGKSFLGNDLKQYALSRLQLSDPLTAETISEYAKSIFFLKKKKKATKDIDPELVRSAERDIAAESDTTWQDMLALTKVLICYGCLKSTWSPGLSDDELESASFTLTSAGEHIGMLSFQNSLWCLVAMGGAHDVLAASSRIDDNRSTLLALGDEEEDLSKFRQDLTTSLDLPSDELKENQQSIQLSQQESMTLATQLKALSAHELAGYVSCLISDGYRRGGHANVAEAFQKLTYSQQRAIQSCLSVCERLVEVQRVFQTGDVNTRCDLDLSNVHVVTAWANGCSWAEALELSGTAPGDLARMLGRVLDALRQIGNLTFNAVRGSDMDASGIRYISLGVSSELRNLCREAARAMNRFPVKDPLPFATDDIEVEDDFVDEEN